MRRHALLSRRPSHMVELIKYNEWLRTILPDAIVPDFDPAGDGVGARVLYLAQNPGPACLRENGGSGLLCTNNNDDTAANTLAILRQLDVPQQWILFANAVPWWSGTLHTKATERRLAREHAILNRLIDRLPRLKAIILAGRVAQAGWKRTGIDLPNIRIFPSAHPGARVRQFNRPLWDAIPSQWPKRSDLV